MRTRAKPPFELILNLVELGQLLRARREEMGLTIKQFADLADLNSGTVGEIERGDVIATLPALHAMARAGGFTLDITLRDEDERDTTDRGSECHPGRVAGAASQV